MDRSGKKPGFYLLSSISVFGFVAVLTLMLISSAAARPTPEPTPRETVTPGTATPTYTSTFTPTPTKTRRHIPPIPPTWWWRTRTPTSEPTETPTEEEEEEEETGTPTVTSTPTLEPVTPILDVTDTPPPRPAVVFIPTQPPPTPVPPTSTNTSTPTGTPTSTPTATGTATPTPTPTPPDITPPVPPTGLKATSGDGQVRLDWDPNVEEDLAGYRVYRSTTPGSGYVKVASLGKGLIHYLDNDVLNGVTYYYVLTAFDEMNNESDYSNEVSALPSPSMPPSGGALMPIGCNSLLFWALILLGLLLLSRVVGVKRAKSSEAGDSVGRGRY